MTEMKKEKKETEQGEEEATNINEEAMEVINVSEAVLKVQTARCPYILRNPKMEH